MIASIFNLASFPNEIDMSNSAPDMNLYRRAPEVQRLNLVGYFKRLNEAIRVCMLSNPDIRHKPYEVLAWYKKKHKGLKEALNKRGSPNPATLSRKYHVNH